MRFHFTGRNIAVTPALRRYAETKLARLERFLNGLGTAHVVLRVEKHRQVAEVTLAMRDATLRAEESTSDLYASLDLVADKLERQVLRYKERIEAHGARPGRVPQGPLAPGRGAGPDGGPPGAPGAPAGEGERRVVRVKRFAMKPMTVEDALVQMELLGHTFFVFRHAQTEEVNVLYRRTDGAYGLIEPEG
jgi:putative sigma-54 modulation protein